MAGGAEQLDAAKLKPRQIIGVMYSPLTVCFLVSDANLNVVMHLMSLAGPPRRDDDFLQLLVADNLKFHGSLVLQTGQDAMQIVGPGDDAAACADNPVASLDSGCGSRAAWEHFNNFHSLIGQ
jgi:hypothetical protein